MDPVPDSGGLEVTDELSFGVADSMGEAGTDGKGENVVRMSGEAGILPFGSEKRRLRWLEVARRAFSLSDGM